MSQDIVTLDGLDLREAPVLMADCSMPIFDWRRRCMTDQVLANMPILVDHWNDDVTVPGIVDSVIEVDTTGIVDPDCEAAVVKVAHTSCEMKLPNMKEIAVQSEYLKLKDWKKRFCRQRNVAFDSFCVFDENGRLNTGEPLVIDFMDYAVQTLRQAISQFVYETSLKGDFSNPYQVDGLYTQIDQGWDTDAMDGCSDCVNKGVEIDWAALTGNTECVGPDEVTVEGQTIDICGETCPVPAGLSFSEFLEDIWFPKVMELTQAYGGVDAFEAHVPFHKGKCLINEASCMEPCRTCGSVSCTQHDDPNLRERFAENARSATMELYPSGLRIPVLETKQLEDNTVRIGPRSVGGKNTYGLFFSPLDELFPELPDVNYGSPAGSEPQLSIAPDGGVDIPFENQTLMWSIIQQNMRCFTAEMMACYGVIACWRHIWLKVTNLCCCGCASDCPDTLLVDGNAV